VAVLALATVALADSWKRVGDPGEQMFAQTFKIPKGGEIAVKLGDADLELVRAEGRDSAVEVYVRARNSEKGREYFEKMRFSAELEKDALRIEAPGPSWRDRGFWNDHGGVRVTVVVSVPDGGVLRARTGDGDIRAEAIAGDVSLSTQDGDIDLAGLSGSSVALHTSDGDITGEDIRADRAEIGTSDGDLGIRNVEVETLSMRTSDGDVSVERVVARKIEVKSSDGDVRLSAVEGAVSARTSDGDIRLVLAKVAAVDVRASDGDVTIVIPSDAGVTLDLKAESVSVSGAAVKGDFGERHFAGTIGKGGPTIAARSMGGSVSLDVR
jgi:lia operon protein LiaG